VRLPHSQVHHDRLGRRERQRHDPALVRGPRTLERDDPDVGPGDQVGRKVVEADLDELGTSYALGQHPDHRVVAGVVERPGPPAPGDREQVPDEVGGQRRRTDLDRRVPHQAVGVRVRVPVLDREPAEQVPQVPLLGVGPALAVRREVAAEEPVQRRGVAVSEVCLQASRGHPRAQRDRRVPVGPDRLLLERPPVPVGLRAQPLAVLADHHLPPLRGRAIRASEAAVRDGIRRPRRPGGNHGHRIGRQPQRALARTPAAACSGSGTGPVNRRHSCSPFVLGGELSTLLSHEAKCLAPGCSTTARRPKEPDSARPQVRTERSAPRRIRTFAPGSGGQCSIP
jgi:hypothetical protein